MHAASRISSCIRKADGQPGFQTDQGLGAPDLQADRDAELRTTPRINPGAVHNRPHTLRRQARTDDAFPLAVRGANAMAGARLHRAEPGAPRAPDEGRCRADPHCTSDGDSRHSSTRDLFAVFSSTSAASARVIRHEASEPTPGGEDRRQADVVFPSPKRRQDGDVFQRRRIGQEETYLTEVALPEVRSAERSICKALAAASARRSAQQASAAAAAAAAGQAAPRHRHRPHRPCTGRPPAPAGADRGASDATSTNTADWACIRRARVQRQLRRGQWRRVPVRARDVDRRSPGLPSPAEDYPPAVQDAAALKLYSQRGWEPWTHPLRLRAVRTEP